MWAALSATRIRLRLSAFLPRQVRPLDFGYLLRKYAKMRHYNNHHLRIGCFRSYLNVNATAK